MPEGDTIHRHASRLRPALVGAPLVRFEARRVPPPWPSPGTLIESVDARGKHLLVGFGDGRVLQTHLGMTGSWHLSTPGSRWPKPRHLARVVLEVPDRVAVCFAAPTVRLLAGERAATLATAHLGPDLCALVGEARVSGLDEAVRRMALVPEPDTEIADVLLDQRVAAGIGNVYKSEVLWACRLWPFTPLHEVAEPARRWLLETATEQLRANLGPGPRRTVPGGLAVYGRTRRPCPRCGTPVRSRRSGPQARSTYWCPTCQPGRAGVERHFGERPGPRRPGSASWGSP